MGVVVLGHGGPGCGVDGLAVTPFGLDHGCCCRADGGGGGGLSESAGLSGAGECGVDGLLDQDALEAVDQVGELLDVLQASCIEVG